MTRLVIFDLDGTLLNTIDDLAISTNYALRQFGFPEHALTEYPYFVGNGITKLIERALPPDRRDEDTVNRLKQEFVKYYQQHKTDLTRPYRGIPSVLEVLNEKGILMAVASNKYHQGTDELIRHYFGSSLFKVIAGQKDGIPPKPDPAVIHFILSKTGVSPADALYVGDSGVDMQTAAHSGVTSVGVTWGFRPRRELEENGANHIAERPYDILNFIQTH